MIRDKTPEIEDIICQGKMFPCAMVAEQVFQEIEKSFHDVEKDQLVQIIRAAIQRAWYASDAMGETESVIKALTENKEMFISFLMKEASD